MDTPYVIYRLKFPDGSEYIGMSGNLKLTLAGHRRNMHRQDFQVQLLESDLSREQATRRVLLWQETMNPETRLNPPLRRRRAGGPGRPRKPGPKPSRKPKVRKPGKDRSPAAHRENMRRMREQQRERFQSKRGAPHATRKNKGGGW